MAVARVQVATGYEPPGPVAARFMASDAPIRMLMGPVGSGKTSACMWDLWTRACRQRPSPRDRVRYSRWAIIRDTHEQLKKTTIRSWNTWFPQTVGKWIAGPPAEHILIFPHPSGDGTMVNMHVVFIGLGEHSVEDVLRGMELTGAYLNEADLQPADVLRHIRQRVGRFPSKADGGASWYGVILDMNAPDYENWTVGEFVDKQLPDHEFYRQPSGLSPQAENLQNLPPGYYDNLVRDAHADPNNVDAAWWVRRMVENEFGYSRAGQPVFMEFRDALHFAAEPMPIDPRVPLGFGSDAGRTPAIIIGQETPEGRWLIHDEVVLTGATATQAGEAVNRKLAEAHFAEARAVKGTRAFANMRHWGDPAAAFPSDTSEQSWLDLFAAETGIETEPAPGENVLHIRLAVVKHALTGLIAGAPALQISPRCVVIRKAFNSGYHYRRIREGAGHRIADAPAKNAYSHPMDGLQNFMLGEGGHDAVWQRRHERDRGNELLAQGAIIDESLPNAVSML